MVVVCAGLSVVRVAGADPWLSCVRVCPFCRIREIFRGIYSSSIQERLLIADMSVAASEAAFEWTRT